LILAHYFRGFNPWWSFDQNIMVVGKQEKGGDKRASKTFKGTHH
jgi:hypothetical protein